MAINQFNYLDIGNLFINELIGNFWVAIIIIMVIVIYFAAKNNLPSIVTISLLLVFTVGITAYYYSSLLLAIAGLVIGLLIYGAYSKWISR